MKERSITADVFYVLTIMGSAWFMIWAFPAFWVWTMMALQKWLSDLFPHFMQVMMFSICFTCILPIPCCLAGYILMRRNKEEMRYPGATFLFWLNFIVILFFGSALIWGLLCNKLPF